MDPITIGLAAVGLGLQLFGGAKQAEEAQKQQQIQRNIQGLEVGVNAQRKQAMELSASRQQLENIRNVQRARAQGMSAAVNQGAQFGSGIQGGQAQAQSMGAWNNLGITQNLEIGRNIFGLNDQISAQKTQLSQSQSASATDAGWATLGGALVKNSGTISNIAGFGKAQFNSNFGSYPGTYTSQNIPT